MSFPETIKLIVLVLTPFKMVPSVVASARLREPVPIAEIESTKLPNTFALAAEEVDPSADAIATEPVTNKLAIWAALTWLAIASAAPAPPAAATLIGS